ncbi:18747_t:CDS:1, partial [Racocetra fulgida]
KNIFGAHKKAIKLLEYCTATLVNYFLQLLQLAIKIKYLSDSVSQNFQNDCLALFNK